MKQDCPTRFNKLRPMLRHDERSHPCKARTSTIPTKVTGDKTESGAEYSIQIRPHDQHPLQGNVNAEELTDLQRWLTRSPLQGGREARAGKKIIPMKHEAPDALKRLEPGKKHTNDRKRNRDCAEQATAAAKETHVGWCAGWYYPRLKKT